MLPPNLLDNWKSLCTDFNWLTELSKCLFFSLNRYSPQQAKPAAEKLLVLQRCSVTPSLVSGPGIRIRLPQCSFTRVTLNCLGRMATLAIMGHHIMVLDPESRT